ncbi:TonB-dependent receptor precursor [Sphingopyxis sp. LC81]|uniref:TonB-dependent receptor n=1 Tax=Sphingopyxis sp. LC81 TaxID=1502850 RepID=UPI00050FD835|nr:TonB-dependent receptor [Sphingopyxis sp. LC81]KGB54702.1 TonB-dependent receptor precursor [Sphingopyxis sp. LC81]
MSGKSRFYLSLMVGIACLHPVAAAAQLQDRQSFDLPTQDLGDALRKVAAQAGIELYASSTDLAGRKAPPLNGDITPREAIEILLRGTGLTARFESGSVIILGRAQSESSPAQEDIVVTGSRIAGAPSAAPVVRVTSEDIRNGGQADLGEVARSLPQNFGGGFNPGIGNGQGAPNENANVNGASTFNLRGIGPNATLTLINGNRFAYTGVSSVIDVSAIPVSAVERIEIVADGASAIYGADAVAGVVNILLKRDYEGLSATARVGASTDGGNMQQQYGLLGGKAWSLGGLLAAYDYSRSSAIRAGDRDYAGAANTETMLFPATWRHSLLVSGHQALGPHITLAADLLYKKSRLHSVTGYSLALAPDELGLDNVSTSESFGIAPSLSAELGGDWRFKASGFFGTDRTGGYSDLFFGGNLLAHIDKHFFNRNLALEAGFQGPLFVLPAGDVRMAVGGGARRNHFFAASPTGDVRRRRDNLFAYGELLIPVTAPAQKIAWFHSLSLTAALRFEDYSDAPSIMTPKIGVVWEPAEILRLGASWGRSFKMPTLYQQYSGYSAIMGRAARYGSGYPASANIIFAAGPDSRLGPERSDNMTLSAQLTPTHGLEFTAAWYRIDYTDRVATPIPSLVGVLDNPLYAGLVTLDPNADELAAIIDGALLGLENNTGRPYDPATIVAFIDARDRNIARQRYSGIDLSMRYRIEFDDGKELALSAAGSFLKSRQQILPGAAWAPLAGTLFRPSRFRGRAGVTYVDDRFTLAAFVNHMSGLDDDRQAVRVRIPSYTTLDLTARVRFGKNTEVSLAALNLFNAKPTAIVTALPSETPYDTTNYSPAGRFVGLTARQEW